MAGVSHGTVSLVLNGRENSRISAVRREQILSLARKHGYRPNPAARALVIKRTLRISVCVTGSLSSHAMLGEFSLHAGLAEFAKGLKAAGYAVEIMQVDSAERPECVSREISRQVVDGFILLDWPVELASKVGFSLKEKAMPTVVWRTPLEDEGLSWTATDDRRAFDDIATMLIRENRRELALLDTTLRTDRDKSRILRFDRDSEGGFLAAVARELKQDGSSRILRPVAPTARGVRDMVDRALGQLGKVDGLVLTDTYNCQVVVDALERRGIRPGLDCRVVAYGDAAFADAVSPQVTHFRPCWEEQVAFCMQSLLDQIARPAEYEARHKVFTAQLVERET